MKSFAVKTVFVFSILGFVVPMASAQYWPDMRKFNAPSTEDVMAARVQQALAQSKYRAEIASYRKYAVTAKVPATPALSADIIANLVAVKKDVDAYLASLKATAKYAAAHKDEIKNPYGLMGTYKDITKFSEVSEKLSSFVAVTSKCDAILNHKVAGSAFENAVLCKKVVSARTLGYAKIMRASFKKNDRDTFFDAQDIVAKQLKAKEPKPLHFPEMNAL